MFFRPFDPYPVIILTVISAGLASLAAYPVFDTAGLTYKVGYIQKA